MASVLDANSAGLKTASPGRRGLIRVRSLGVASALLLCAGVALGQSVAYAQSSPRGSERLDAAERRGSRERGGSELDYEQLIERASAAYRAKEYLEARSLFEQAHAIAPTARTLRGLGVTAVSLRRYNTATDELEAALQEKRRPLMPAEQREARALLDWMKTSLATLELELSPAHATALIDDRRITQGSLLLDPGDHVLQARADGYEPQTRRFSLDQGRTQSLQIQLTRSVEVDLPNAALLRSPGTPAHASAVQEETTSIFGRWWFWTGVAAVAIGGAITAVALNGDEGPRYESGGVGGVHHALVRFP